MEQSHRIDPPIIALREVSKQYRGKEGFFFPLQKVSLEVSRGDIFGIIGPSGSGKSTLIRTLAGLMTPSSGAVLFKTHPLAQMTKSSLRRFRTSIGMVFQHANLLNSRTAAGNIAYPLEIAGISKEDRCKRVDELLHLVGLHNKKDAYPAKLSGGEKQRVGIARALAHHPEILLCDEATSALDPKTTDSILELLKRLHRTLKITIVLITHDMEVIKKLCTKVAVLDQGVIVEQGKITEIFANPIHETTQYFLQTLPHPIPPEFLKKSSENRKMLRLVFKGDVTEDPIISEMVRRWDINANILMGWIDRIQSLHIGTLVVELTGKSEQINQALHYLREKKVHYEEIEYG